MSAVDTAAPATPETRSGRSVLVTLIPLMLVLFISNLDQTIVATALPTIGRDLRSLSGTSWVATAYLLTSAITTLIFGKLGDMHSRKKIFQFSIAVFLIGSALCGAAQSMTMLILFRALQGIGGGGLNSLVMAIIGDIVPARQRSKYQASFGMVATVALIAGPLLGGLFSQALDWRWIFYLNLPIGVVALVAVAARLHLPKPAATAGRVDAAGALIATVFTTAVMLFTSWGGTTHPWSSPLILGLVALSVGSLIAYLLVERRAAQPITPLHLFRSGVFNIASVQFFVAAMVLFVAMLYIPMFMQTVQGVAPFRAGLYVIPLLIGLIIAAMTSGPAITKTGHYKIYPIVGAVLTGGAMYWLSRADQHTGSLGLLVPLFVAGAGLGFFVQVSVLAGQNAVDYKYLGVATGTLNFFKSLGGAFGAALFGSILTAALHSGPSVHAFHLVFLLTVPFEVLALVLALVMREKPLSEEMIEVAAGTVEAPEY